MTGSLSDHAGGAPALLAFARAHRARCLADPQVRHRFVASGLDPGYDDRLAAHLGEVWDVPPASVRDGPGSAARPPLRHPWPGGAGDLGHGFLDSLLRALDDAGLPDDQPFRTAVTAYLQWVVAVVPAGAAVRDTVALPTWTWDSPVAVAADNNAARIEDVARTAGVVGRREPHRWWAPRRPPPLHPDVVTLRPDLTAAEVLAGVEPGPGRSVKDSWADLDLTDDGFTVLLEGSWLWRGAARDTTSALGWTWTATRTDDLEARRGPKTVASCNVTRSGPVVGVTNLDAPGVDRVAAWREVGAALAAVAPHAPVVAWEPAGDVPAAVAAGFVVTGPMRVWSDRFPPRAR